VRRRVAIMGSGLTGWTGLIVVVLIILLFGAPKLPGLARSLGQSLKIFKSEMKPEDKASEEITDASDSTVSADESDSTKN
jgi:sec-independent protein translocase protein TatA